MTACFADGSDAVERGRNDDASVEHCWRDVLERLTHKWSIITGENAEIAGTDVW